MVEESRRITNTWLIDDDGTIQNGDFLLFKDGRFENSKGDEDVLENNQ